MEFFRRCLRHAHLGEPEWHTNSNGTETITCKDGHKMTRWAVIDVRGVVVGIGYKDGPGYLLDGLLEKEIGQSLGGNE